MARTARAAVGGGIYHVLNRGNGRMRIFRKPGDYLAFFALPLGGREKRRGCEHENKGGCHLFWSAMGRKSDTTITPAAGIGGSTAQSFQYDGVGRLTTALANSVDGGAAVNLAYDSLGRTVEEGQLFGGHALSLTNSAFTSLPASQFTYPNDRQVNAGYDALYRKNSIVEAATGASIASWQFFGNRLATAALGNGLLGSNMNNAQTRSAIQAGQTTPPWGNISTDQLGYDGAGRMMGKRFFSGANVIVGFTAAYDEGSNKLFERPLHAEERSSLYDSYDSMNRLLDDQRGVLASGGGSITTPITLPHTDTGRNWSFDGLGNWSSSVFIPVGGGSQTDQRNHNKLNEVIQRTVTGQPPVTFQYDGATGASNGNLANDGTLIYAYDALNRLIQVSKVITLSPTADFGGVGGGVIGSLPLVGGVAGSVTSQVIASYFYDALNRRIRKTISNGGLTGNIPNGTTDYLWLGWQTMEECNWSGGGGGTDTPIRQYVWGQYIDECIQLTTLAALGPQNLPAGAYYLLQDLLYRGAALTNASGAIAEAYDTDAYGNTLVFTAPDSTGNWWSDSAVQSSYGANEIIYCGYRYDAETELYYVRNRTYNPVLGRWLQRDPIGYQGGVNLYEYVDSMPVTDMDASGECPAGYRFFTQGQLMDWGASLTISKAVSEWRDPSLASRFPAKALKVDPWLQGFLIPPSAEPHCRRIGYCVRLGPPLAKGKEHVISRGPWIVYFMGMKMKGAVLRRELKYWEHIERRVDMLLEYWCNCYTPGAGNRPQPGGYPVDVYYGSAYWTEGRSYGHRYQYKTVEPPKFEPLPQIPNPEGPNG